MKKIIPLIMALTLSNAFAQNSQEINNREISTITVSANDYPSHKNELPPLSVNKENSYNVNIFIDNEKLTNKALIAKPNKEFYILYFSNNFKDKTVKDRKYETKSYIIPQDEQTVTMLFKIITTVGKEKLVKCHTVNSCTVITPFKYVQEIKVQNILVHNNDISLYFTQARNGLNLEVK